MKKLARKKLARWNKHLFSSASPFDPKVPSISMSLRLSLLFFSIFFTTEVASENSSISSKLENSKPENSLYSNSQLTPHSAKQISAQTSTHTLSSDTDTSSRFVSSLDLIAQEDSTKSSKKPGSLTQEPTDTKQAGTKHPDTKEASKDTHTAKLSPPLQKEEQPKEISLQESGAGPVINFNNVSIVEFLRFVSRLTGRNFIFDPDELQFTVTIISESPASLDDIMAALLQNLRIHEFELSEQGNGFLIYRNKEIKSPAGLFRTDNGPAGEPQIATQVFLIEYVDPARVGAIIKSMVSKEAIVELIPESKRLVVTDIANNIKKIAELLTALDSPKSGLEIGQYVGQNSSPAALANMAEKLLTPVLAGQTFVLVPHVASNSIFVIASPFLVEKALSIMQTIDLGENTSRILSFDEMKFDADLAQKMLLSANKKNLSDDEIEKLTDEQIRKILREKGFTDAEIDRMTKAERNKHLKELELGPEGESIAAEIRKRKIFESPLPLGQVESTQFYIYKLQYRKADDVVKALRSIAISIQATHEKEPTQSDLLTTLDSLQIIDANNSIVLTGTEATLQKAKTLIADIDIAARQVLIEVLVLDTTLTNSLNFGVDSGVKFQKRNFVVEGGFFGSGTPNVLGALSQVTGVPVPPPPPLPHSTIPFDLSPDVIIGTPNVVSGAASNFNAQPPSPGFAAGSIGRKIIYNGNGFLAVAALVNAVRTDVDTNIIMNPKITTEHNVPAELFVGQQVGIKGQSVANNNGNILTTNFEQQETGVLLKVTPLISSSDTITLIVEQRISTVSQAAVNAQASPNAPPATINETRTITRVHLPSEHFIILSGMITENQTINKTEIPCLGALPLVGALFSQNSDTNNKRNLLIFLRPYVIDTEIDIDDLTKKQQDIFKEKSKPMREQRGIFDDLKTMLNL